MCSSDLQSKLLRVLQEGTYERVGDETTRKVDVRIIAATNRILKDEVQAGRFRQDLYYRLNVFPVEVPPLRERMEDIPSLATHFLKSASKNLNVPNVRITQANLIDLQNYDWPGNVRELQNVIERAAIISRGGKLLLNLPKAGSYIKSKKSAEPISNGEILTDNQMKEREKENILKALDQAGGKVTGKGGAADLLQMKPTTLYSRINKMGIGLK